jgi:hypothetical protein
MDACADGEPHTAFGDFPGSVKVAVEVELG